jgi:hypothetical protein
MPGIICFSCGQSNMRGAFLCAYCGVLLEATARVRPITNKLRTDSDGTGSQSLLRTAHEGELGIHSVAIYMPDTEKPVIVPLTGELVIGRTSPTDSELPRLDLSAYRAQERGVSRRHIILKRTPEGVMMEDLGSSNGTWLNGTLVLPFSPKLIQSGDQIRLGQFELEIYLP